MVRFRSGVGSAKKARVEGSGFDAFEVEYSAPDAAVMLEADSKHTMEGIGRAALWLCSRCLTSWTLERPLGATVEERAATLGAIDPAEALLAMYLVLREDGREQLKN